MLKKLLIAFMALSFSVVLSSCGKETEEAKKVVVKKSQPTQEASIPRWYTASQKMRGRKIFKDNCAVCHGDKGQGLVANWKKQQSDGKFPTPPLNGSAHAWHHSKELLLRTINIGGIPIGGSMPAFKDKLSDVEKEAVLAHVMSLWPDQIYNTWAKRNQK